MAQQKGIIKLKGKIGDLSFYKTQDGYLAREKGGIDTNFFYHFRRSVSAQRGIIVFTERFVHLLN